MLVMLLVGKLKAEIVVTVATVHRRLLSLKAQIFLWLRRRY